MKETIKTSRTVTGTGSGSQTGTAPAGGSSNPNSHSIKYTCPCCKASVRATKIVNIICGDCMVKMQPQQ